MVKSRHNHPIEILCNIISVRWWSSDLRDPIWVMESHLSLGICSFRWQRSRPSWQRWRQRHERPKRCWKKNRYYFLVAQKMVEFDSTAILDIFFQVMVESKFWCNHGLKWSTSSGSSSLCFPMWNSDQMTIGKTHPTLICIVKFWPVYLLWGHVNFWCFEANFVGSWHFVFLVTTFLDTDQIVVPLSL